MSRTHKHERTNRGRSTKRELTTAAGLSEADMTKIEPREREPATVPERVARVLDDAKRSVVHAGESVRASIEDATQRTSERVTAMKNEAQRRLGEQLEAAGKRLDDAGKKLSHA
jgi:hypothetical protein